MPNIYFIIFELIIYIQFALCLRHAVKHGMPYILRLLTGAAFGVLLELATIRQLNAYEYGRFVLMVLDVPLCIGVAWSCIMYSAMEFSNGSSLPYWTRPVLDGLLALNIDLALDTVAIRLGFWDWGQGLDFQYFGVPYANFWAWFWVVFSFSFGYRLLALRQDWIGKWIPAFLALLTGLIGVLATNALITFLIPWEYHILTVASLILLACMGTVLLRPLFYQEPVNSVAFWIPFLSHAYLLVAGIVSGVIFEPPVLLFISLAMFTAALILHKPSIQHAFARKVNSSYR